MNQWSDHRFQYHFDFFSSVLLTPIYAWHGFNYWPDIIYSVFTQLTDGFLTILLSFGRKYFTMHEISNTLLIKTIPFQKEKGFKLIKYIIFLSLKIVQLILLRLEVFYRLFLIFQICILNYCIIYIWITEI